MMATEMIPQLDNLLTDILQSKKIIKVDENYLTAPGENYASLMLGLELTLQNEDNSEEIMHVVAKLLPDSEFMRIFQNVKFTFRNELAFYQVILPTLKEHCSLDIDCYPKFYGGRMGLTPGKFDDNAVILMENLKVKDYVLLDKNQGLDLNTTKMILKKLAELHGSVIGLRENHKDIFEKKLKPYFGEYEIFVVDGEAYMQSEIIVNAIIDVLKNDKFCAPHVDRVRKAIKISMDNLKLPRNSSKFQKDVFSTIIHDDLWVNNIMAKVEKDKVVDVKILDWQLYQYASATKDLIFFFGSSVAETILDENFDEIISFYYDNLLNVLKKFKCDEKKYSFDVFEKEFKVSAGELTYYLLLTQIAGMFPTDEKVVEITELSMDKFFEQFEVSDICRSRICLLTKKLLQKGWL